MITAAATGARSAPIRGRSALRSARWSCVLIALLPSLVLAHGARGQPAAAVIMSEDGVRRLQANGDYAEAEQQATALLTQVEHGRSDPAALADALDLLVSVRCANGRGATPDTRAFSERSLQLRSRIPAASSPAHAAQLAASRLLHADVLADAGLYREALAEYTRVLEPRGGAAGLDTQLLADGLGRFGRALTSAEQFDQAKHVLTRALDLAKSAALDGTPLQATLRERLAAVQMQQADFDGARANLDAALAIRRKTSPEGVAAEHPDLVITFNLLGDLRWFDGKIPEADAFYRRALTLAQQRLRPGHPAIALCLKNIGSSAYALGDLQRSREARQEALDITERAFGPMHPEVAICLNNLANLARIEGDFTKAQRLFERVLAITEQRFGRSHLRNATFLLNIAILRQNLGDLDAAIRIETRAIGIWQREFGPRHQYVARALSALGSMQTSAGRYRSAAATYTRALRIREDKLGPFHRDVARTLVDLASVLTQQGQQARAAPLLARAVTIWERLAVTDDPDFARALGVIGRLDLDRNELADARETLERALAMQTRILGPTHPEVARVRADLAGALLQAGDVKDAVSQALDAESIARGHLRLTMQDLPERVALAFAATRAQGLDVALSAVSRGEATGEDTTRVLDELIQSRAVVLDEMALRQRLSAAGDPGLAALYAALRTARQRFANLTIHGPEGMKPEQYRRLIDQAGAAKEEAEHALAEQSAPFRTEVAQSRIALADVREAMPADTALVSFVRYRRVSDTSAYLAFVSRGAAPPVAISLGDAEAIDRAVAEWRRQVSAAWDPNDPSPASRERKYRRVGAMLRQRIWDPLHDALANATRVIIVPDGALNVVSFAALPVEGGGYLVEQDATLHYLSAERDLVTKDVAREAGRGVLIMGDPAFGPRQTASASGSTTTRSACGTLQTLQFDDLPASRTEAIEVARLWSRAQPGSDVAADKGTRVLSGRAASERAFKEQAPGKRILHLATHGFFLGDTCEAIPTRGARGIGGLAPARDTSSAVHGENPLILSGLALAGANQRASVRADQDDGILTAEEVASLDLSAVEWAVLSACDTGIGEVKSGEGVFGLRRALHVAGARTVVMSLWSVEDRSTLDWMRALYDGRFSHALDTPTAVRQASLSVLQARRAQGRTTHPFFWAGFVAVGDWH